LLVVTARVDITSMSRREGPEDVDSETFISTASTANVYTQKTHSIPWNKIFLLYVLRSVD